MRQNVNGALHKVSNTDTDLGGVTITPAIGQHLNGMIVDPFTNHLIISGDGRAEDAGKIPEQPASLLSEFVSMQERLRKKL
jgi:hypothetical protein